MAYFGREIQIACRKKSQNKYCHTTYFCDKIRMENANAFYTR